MMVLTSVVENNADSDLCYGEDDDDFDICYGENDNSDVCDDGNVSALVN